MPLNLPQITGQVPHDVEQAIQLMQAAINRLQADLAELRRMVGELTGKRG